MIIKYFDLKKNLNEDTSFFFIIWVKYWTYRGNN